MNIVGLTHGHNGTVSLVKDNALYFCQSEERFNRIKNSTGFPHETLEYLYKNIIDPKDIDLVVIFEASVRGYTFLKRNKFKSFQYSSYLSPNEKFGSFIKKSWPVWHLTQFYFKNILEKNKFLIQESYQYFENVCRVPIKKIKFIDHHESHAFSTLGGITDWSKGLIFTLDAVGDYNCATVSIFENGEINKLEEDDYSNSLGAYYAAITSLLGMKSNEHEFKVMGLAPYANKVYYEKILNDFRNLITVNSKGKFQSKVQPKSLHERLFKIIKFQRFDNVAAAIQELTEELILKWIKYWSEKYSCNNIAVSGGVFMNVKACQRICEANFVEKFFVTPSSGDESSAIGSVFWAHKKFNKSLTPIKLNDLYLGIQYSDKEIGKCLNELEIFQQFKVIKSDDINELASKLLADNEVIARFDGKMEFGARALGNRSILSSPKDFQVIEKINALIKVRDFWMPFAPSILEEDMDKYIVNPKKIFAPYMSLTFNTTKLAHKELSAAIHPRDKTARPQCVVKNWNPKYHDLIYRFKKKTGIGAVLNTSFNLHGEPNVCSPYDAIKTFKNSGIKYLLIGNYLIEKN